MEHRDVIIIGAGLSGIGAACRLGIQCPQHNYLILEERDAIGGTWDLFRYPGIRSDSDMHTLGYDFKPWLGGQVLADGPSIRAYVREAAVEHGVEHNIRFGQRVISAEWSSIEACWTITTRSKTEGKEQHFRCNMLLMCTGYYRYGSGYTPEFKGMEQFAGDIIHPQHWPENLDYSGKRVVIIGSGATAVTLVPAMAKTAASVTMLQRSPTYMANRSQVDSLGELLRKILPEKTAYRITRWKNAQIQRIVYKLTRLWPDMMKRMFINEVRKQLAPDYDVDTHFTPHYNPWDQRLCAVPENDLFHAIRDGCAEVITEHIDQITNSGIRLASGKELEADIIVTATGLHLVVNGEVAFSRDEQPIDFSDCWTYKGMMFSDVPNLVNTFGYINASWTLRADLVSNYFCRLLNHMKSSACQQVTARLRPEDADMPARPWVDDFSSGYMDRTMHLMPKQGDRAPWVNSQNYLEEKTTIGRSTFDDGVLEFSHRKNTEVA